MVVNALWNGEEKYYLTTLQRCVIMSPFRCLLHSNLQRMLQVCWVLQSLHIIIKIDIQTTSLHRQEQSIQR